MLHHHQSHDVAVRRQIGLDVEKRGEVIDVTVQQRVLAEFTGRIGADNIAHVRLIAMVAGDVPSPPAFVQRAVMIDEGPAVERFAAMVGKKGACQMSGNLQGIGRHVAGETVCGADELGWLFGRLRQGVKHASLLGIDCRNLQSRTPRSPTDVGLVIEVNRPRCFGADQLAVQ